MEEKLRRRKQKAQNEDNKNLLISICSELAGLYNNRAHYNKAIEEYEFVAELYEQIGKRMECGVAHRMIGEIYSVSLLDFDKALQHQEIHLDIARELSNPLEEQRALATIGRTHLTKAIIDTDNIDKEELNAAYKSFMKSLMICESLKNIGKVEQMDMRCRLLLNLGIVREHQADYTRAVEYMERAIIICKQTELYDQLHQTYNALSGVYMMMNDYSKAIRCLNLALDIAKRFTENKVTAMCGTLVLKSEVMIKLADFNGAKQVLLKAYKLKTPNKEDRENIERCLKIVAAMCYTEDSLLTIEENNYVEKRKLYEKMGDGACELKNYTKAVDYYKKMLECTEKIGETGKSLSAAYVSLAQTYKDNKQFDLSINYFEKDYELCKNNPNEAYITLLNIIDVMEAMNRDYSELELYLKRARDEARKSPDVKCEKSVIQKMIFIQRKYKKNNLADQLEKELQALLKMDDGDSSDSDDCSGTPNIGDDINISDISDLSEGSDFEEGNAADIPRSARKRGKCLTIKKNSKGETQLHLACISGNATLVRRLLDQGHVVNVRDNCGWLPIHEAAICGHKEIVKMLLDKGAAINDRGGTLCNGITPLHDAASNGHLDIMEFLLERGASATAKSGDGDTPLDILRQWRSIVGKLDPIKQSHYEEILTKLISVQEKTGTAILSSQSTQSSFGSNKPIAICRPLTPDNVQNKPSSSKNKKRSSDEFRARNHLDNSDSEDETITRATGKRKNVTENSSSSDESSSSTENGRSNVGFKARLEYKRVMDSLRNSKSVTEKRNSFSSPTKQPALIQGSATDDNWLEDDMGLNQKAKRRKTFGGTSKKEDDFVNTNCVSKSSKTSLSLKSNSRFELNEQKFEKPVCIPVNLCDNEEDEIIDSDITFNENDKNIYNIRNEIPIKESFENIESKNLVGDNEPHSYQNDTSINLLSNRKRLKSQISLIDAGFSRQVGDSIRDLRHRQPSKETIDTNHRQFGSIGNQNVMPFCIASQNQQMPMYGINVKIEGKTWRVPVSSAKINDLTIGWLAKEAAKRYYNKEGIKPILQLESREGAIFSDEDPVSMIISSNENEIYSTVLSWDLPPLLQRYHEACNNSNSEMDLSLNEHLEKCQATLVLGLNDLALTDRQVNPVMKALQHQSRIRELKLAWNMLSNNSINSLCASLPTLTNLQVLDLSNNCITCEGLEHIANVFLRSTEPLLTHLEDVNFSYNSLGNGMLKHLSVISRNVQLKSINVSSCDITDFTFDVIFNFASVEFFDISFNALKKSSIARFMSCLKGTVLKYLNLSATTEYDGGATKVVTNFLSQTGISESFEEIHLSRCNVTDAEIWEFLNVSAASLTNFKVLDLSYNNELTFQSLQRILKHKPALSSVYLEGCYSVHLYFNDATSTEMWIANVDVENIIVTCPKSQHLIDNLITLWGKKWNDKMIVKKSFGGYLHLSIERELNKEI